MVMSICYLLVISILSFFVGRVLPYSWFSWDRFPFKSFPFERQGKIYLKLRINRWQKRVPDMSKILPGLIPPKNMRHYSLDSMPVMVAETCIAELIHWGNSILSLACFWMWQSPWCVLIVFIYIFIGNLPFVLIQRYNRPRFVNLMKRLKSKQEQVFS